MWATCTCTPKVTGTVHYLGAVGYIKADVKVEATVIHRLELDDGHLGLGDDLRDGRARETYFKQAGAMLFYANDRSDDRVQDNEGDAAVSYACSFLQQPIPPHKTQGLACILVATLRVCSSLASALSPD